MNNKNLKIRPARPEDDSFLAWVMLTAARSHVGRGLWDLVIEGTEEERLTFLKLTATTKRFHFCHYSNFYLIEKDGRPASAAAGYNPANMGVDDYNREFHKIARKLGLSNDEATAALKRAAPCSSCQLDTTAGSWVIENVATLPEFRRRGLADRLLERVLDEGRRKGFKISEVGVFIGNAPAQRAYEKRGFKLLNEKRHPDFEAAFGSPGMAQLIREL